MFAGDIAHDPLVALLRRALGAHREDEAAGQGLRLLVPGPADGADIEDVAHDERAAGAGIETSGTGHPRAQLADAKVERVAHEVSAMVGRVADAAEPAGALLVAVHAVRAEVLDRLADKGLEVLTRDHDR